VVYPIGADSLYQGISQRIFRFEAAISANSAQKSQILTKNQGTLKRMAGTCFLSYCDRLTCNAFSAVPIIAEQGIGTNFGACLCSAS
jgi:hypothetical protein